MNAKSYKGIIHWFTHNPVAANLLMIAILFAGALSLMTIKRSLNPDIEANTIEVSVAYLGAAPEEVERSVTIKIEERIKDIEGISRFYSVSDNSLSSIVLEVADGYDVLEILDQVQSSVDGIKSFPEEIEKPLINRKHIKRQAVMVQIYGDMSELGMKTLANQLKLEMSQNPALNSIDILGVRPFEVSVEISEATLRKHQLTINEVVRAINNFSVDIPGGSIKTERGNILLRTSGQAYNQYEFENIVLKSFSDSSQILLGDIATINDGFAEVDGFARFNGKPSVALAVYATGEQDILEVAREAQQFVTERKASLPKDVSLVTWADVTYYLESRIDMMSSNMLIGAILVFAILTLFLDIYSAFWVMAGLPVCFLGAFALMPLDPFNISLNMFSLFGFLLVLGIVVDDAIIISESIHHQTDEYGSTLDNVVKGAQEVALPATFGVLTTIAAFSPTVFVSGQYSALPQSIGYVVIFCLFFSLIESKWILPAHLGRRCTNKWTKNHPEPLHSNTRHSAPFFRKLEKVQIQVDDALNHFLEFKYRPFLKSCLDKRYITIACFVGMIVITLGLFTSGIVRLTMIPDIPSDFLIAKIEMREGTSDQQMREALATMENAIVAIDSEWNNNTPEKSGGLIEQRLVMSNDGRTGLIMLELVKNDQRNVDSNQLINAWRERVGEIAGAKLINFSSVEDAGGAPLAFKIVGSDVSQLTAAADALESKIDDYNGVFDIENGSSDINDEIHINIKPSSLSLGLSLADIGTQVRQAFYGAEAQRIQRGNDEIKVMVRYPEKDRHSLANLENMYITTPAGEAVPFSAVASLELRRSLAKNTRINGEKAITVTARIDKGQAQPGRISKEIMKTYAPELEKQFPGIKLKLDGASVEEEALIEKIFISMLFAMVAIYILLAIPLRSYSQPIMIMIVIPFGIIGAVIGHIIMGASVNMLSFFGIIALSGVVVNDSLVLVSFINTAKNNGARMQQAIIDAGIQRFRAIMITSLTTFVGLAPMLFETSLQAQLVVPMAISLSFGIVFATVITLILIPCLYQVLHDMHDIKASWSTRSNRPADDSIPILNQ